MQFRNIVASFKLVAFVDGDAFELYRCLGFVVDYAAIKYYSRDGIKQAPEAGSDGRVDAAVDHALQDSNFAWLGSEQADDLV